MFNAFQYAVRNVKNKEGQKWLLHSMRMCMQIVTSFSTSMCLLVLYEFCAWRTRTSRGAPVASSQEKWLPLLYVALASSQSVAFESQRRLFIANHNEQHVLRTLCARHSERAPQARAGMRTPMKLPTSRTNYHTHCPIITLLFSYFGMNQGTLSFRDVDQREIKQQRCRH